MFRPITQTKFSSKIKNYSSISPSSSFSFKRFSTSPNSTPKILITGGCGQIGLDLIPALRSKYGKSNVIATDVVPVRQEISDGPFYYANVLDKTGIERLVVENNISWLIHNTSILSAKGEAFPELAFDVNIVGMKNILDIAKNHKVRLYSPSSIAAFGPTTPRDETPNLTIQRPTTIYGVSKVYGELLGEYYFNRWGVDFRSLRYPGIISASQPGGGTTDYAVEIFFAALKGETYECFLEEDSALPMMYMPDCVKATMDILSADSNSLTQRTYNVSAMSFTPKQLATAIQAEIPSFKVVYKPDYKVRQLIANSWPRSLDDSQARKDWGWKEQYNLSQMVKDMLIKLRKFL